MLTDAETAISTDNCSEIGARRLADRIRSYWEARGYDIKVATRRVANPKQRRNGDSPVFAIVSNIGPLGFPPKKAQQDE